MSVEGRILDAASRRGWVTAPLWSVARRVDRTGHENAELLSVYREWGVVRKADRDDNFNVESDDLSKYKFVRPGDLVLNKMKTWQGSLAVSEFEGIVSPAYFVCTLSDSVYPRFVHYLLRSEPYIAMYAAASKGIRPNQWDLPYEEFRALPMLLPPLDEQQRIADFLDDQVRRIDEIVRLRQQQGKLIRESQVARVERLVEDLRGAARIVPLRYLVREVDVRANESRPEELLSVSIHHGVVPRSQLTDDLPRAADLSNYKLVLRDDLVLNRMSAYQGAVGVANQQGVASPDYAVLRTTSSLDPHFLAAMMKSAPILSEIAIRLRGIGAPGTTSVRTPRLNIDDLRDIRVPLPSLDGQLAFLQRLRASTDVADRARSALEASIALLAEYKRSLITAAVTGEFDVSAASGRGIPA